MTDEDVVRKLHENSGVGSVRHVARITRKSSWVWYVCSKEEIKYVCENIKQYMGERRNTKIREILERIP